MIPGMTISPDAVEALREKDVIFKTKDGSGIRATVFADDLAEVQRQSGIPLIVGDQAIDDLLITDNGTSLNFQDAGKFNSVFVVDQGKVSSERYDKIHLTPFGEIMPGIRRWPWLQDNLLAVGATGMRFELTPGHRTTVLRIRDALSSTPREIRFAAPICYECSDSPLVRNMVFESGVRRADLLAFVTNDGWFGPLDFMRHQHLQFARWRCLELATPGVRAANTGLNAIIDARGRIVRSGTDAEPGAPRVAGILSGEVSLGISRTPLALLGQPVGWASLGSLAALLILTWIRPGTSRTKP
jgi:apolipoprotein N-acyltransferase